MTRKRLTLCDREEVPTESQAADAGPALWQAFAERLASTPLTDRQRRFVAEYLKLLCGAKAARAAGYSLNRCRQQAYDNLHKPKIRRLVRLAQNLELRDVYVRVGLVPPDAKRIPRQERYKT
jgi:hypothetical protein